MVVGLTVPGHLIRYEMGIGPIKVCWQWHWFPVRTKLSSDIGCDREEFGRTRL